MSKLLASLFLLLVGAAASAVPSQVIVVRHAERVPDQPDGSLTPEGLARAELLADMLAAAKVQAIITSPWRRTQETAAPLARRLGITPTVVGARAGEPTAAHVAAVVDAARKLSGLVLIVGHSNTVGEIVEGMTGSMSAPICETSFSNLFIASPGNPAAPVLVLKFGKTDPPSKPGCQ